MIYETLSAEETLALGEKIGQGAAAGDIYTLTGDLGVGKTVFTKGFAKEWMQLCMMQKRQARIKCVQDKKDAMGTFLLRLFL